MVELAKKKKKTIDNQKSLRIWDWIATVFLLLGLIIGSILIYQEQTRQQKLARLQARLQELQDLKKEAQQQYELQDSYLISTANLSRSPAIHSFFTDLLNTYAYKFAKSKGLDISHLPLKFDGLYYDPKTGNGYGEMGRCSWETVIYPAPQKEIDISLNRLYLLNKLGSDKYFTNYLQGDYSYIDISFDKMIDTCSHELAHYIQLVKWGRSSCESDLILGNGKYSAELAKEHQEWTGEIYRMIKLEYSKWEKQWKEI